MSKSSSASGKEAGDRKRPQSGGSFTRDPKTGALKRTKHTKAVEPRAQAQQAARASEDGNTAKTGVGGKQEG